MFGCASSARCVSVVSLGVDVVEEQPDSDAAVGGLDDLAGEQAPGQVGVPDVILQIQAAPRTSRGKRADRRRRRDCHRAA